MRIIEFVEKNNFINLIDKEDIAQRYRTMIKDITPQDILYLHYYEIINEDFYNIMINTFKKYNSLNIDFDIVIEKSYKEPKVLLYCSYVRNTCNNDIFNLRVNNVIFINLISPYMNFNYIRNIKNYCPIINADLDFIANKIKNNNLYIQYDDFVLPIKIQLINDVKNNNTFTGYPPILLDMDCNGFLLDTNLSNTLLKITNISKMD